MTRSLNHSPISALLISQYINGIEIEVKLSSDGENLF